MSDHTFALHVQFRIIQPIASRLIDSEVGFIHSVVPGSLGKFSSPALSACFVDIIELLVEPHESLVTPLFLHGLALLHVLLLIRGLGQVVTQIVQLVLVQLRQKHRVVSSFL